MPTHLFARILCGLMSLLLTLALPVQAVESVTYLHNDAAGSPVAATDAAGNVIWRESYRAYGERTRNETASRANRQFFHGKAFDADTGLSYFGARYYDPVVGRFMAMDPQGFDEANLHSFNRYAYGNNNPYRYTDPSGKVVVPIIIAVGLWLGTEVFGSNPVGPAHAPDAINPTSFPDGSAALKGVGVTLGVIGSLERQGASIAVKEVPLSHALHGEAAKHAEDAIRAGKPDVLTIERAGTAANRQASTGALDKVAGKHLDEYPPAMFKEGGAGASVRPINPRDNMSAGACIGNACRGLPDGTRIRITVGE